MSDPPDSRSYVLAIHDEQARAVDAAGIEHAARRALAVLGVPGGASLEISFVDPARIAELKEEHLGERAETDVLSFPMDDPADAGPGPLVLGDIVICPEVADRQARALGIEPEAEMRHLLVHGVLHVLGRDHRTPAEERAMAAEERLVLAALDDEEGAA